MGALRPIKSIEGRFWLSRLSINPVFGSNLSSDFSDDRELSFAEFENTRAPGYQPGALAYGYPGYRTPPEKLHLG
jgi:hypothetical protein